MQTLWTRHIVKFKHGDRWINVHEDIKLATYV